VNWFKKILTSNANDDSHKAINSQELGEQLFNLCHKHTMSFLDSLNDPLQQKTVKVNREEINQVELLIAFMWLYYDLLQGGKYEKALTQMHTCFMNDMIIKCELPEDEIWHLLQMRYDEYRQFHRSQDAIDFTYQKAAQKICKNILGLDRQNANLDLWVLVAINLQQCILKYGKAIKSIPLKDG
jgi:hypothetical protein